MNHHHYHHHYHYQVINIILAAQENQPSYIVQALDKVDIYFVVCIISTHLYFYLRQVVDILKMSGNDELFSPEMDVIKYRDSDPGLDLLGALLAVSQPAASHT